MICMARTLGAPDNVPAGSTERRASIAPDVLAQAPRDVGHDVDDVRVGLHAHEGLDLDRAVLADPPEVVAAEVDEHHVLRALLLVREQLGGDRASSAVSPPRGRVPAMGRVLTRRPVTVSSGSGEAPTIWKSSKSRKYMYGDGLTARSPR
jgi:hypothetical protein